MEPVSIESVRTMLVEARVLAESRLRTYATVQYREVIEQLDEIKAALEVDVANAFEAARPLGVLAVREFDDGADEEMGARCFQIRDVLRQLAGLPDWR